MTESPTSFRRPSEDEREAFSARLLSYISTFLLAEAEGEAPWLMLDTIEQFVRTAGLTTGRLMRHLHDQSLMVQRETFCTRSHLATQAALLLGDMTKIWLQYTMEGLRLTTDSPPHTDADEDADA